LGGTIDRELTDIFAIRDEITHAIVEQLKVKLHPQEQKSIAQAPTDNIEAYTFYLKGRDFLNRRSKRYLQLARQMFAKAVELDPMYARAYAGMADCDSYLYMTYHEKVAMEKVLATTEKALALDPNLAEAHASRGVALSAGQREEDTKRTISTRALISHRVISIAQPRCLSAPPKSGRTITKCRVFSLPSTSR
jgi:adenylate cyclase